MGHPVQGTCQFHAVLHSARPLRGTLVQLQGLRISATMTPQPADDVLDLAPSHRRALGPHQLKGPFLICRDRIGPAEALSGVGR